MAVTRYRTIGPFYTNGWYDKFDLGQKTWPPQLAEHKTMTDVVGNPKGNNVLVLEHSKANGVFTGDNDASGLARRACHNYASNRRVCEHIHIPNQPTTSEAATMAAARSNPGRSHVSVPNFIFELKDIPRTLNIVGKNYLGSASKANLSFQFGLRPLISDLSKLLDFNTAFNKRKKEFEDLENGMLKRRVAIATQTRTRSEKFVLESNLFWAESAATISTTRKTWATVYWLPSLDFSKMKPGSDVQTQKIRALLRGMTGAQQAKNLWDAVPWSWLVDWFSTAGDFIAASNNSIAHLATTVVVCNHTKSTRTDNISNVPLWCGGPIATWKSERESKTRFMHSPSLSVNVPFLSKGQLSILGSLYVVKRR